jgi:hypothetical protein
MYEQFLFQNEWIRKIFPNVQISFKHNVSTDRSSTYPYLSAILEKILGKDPDLVVKREEYTVGLP